LVKATNVPRQRAERTRRAFTNRAPLRILASRKTEEGHMGFFFGLAVRPEKLLLKGDLGDDVIPVSA